MSVPVQVSDFISRALEEDVGHGDITTESIITSFKKSRAVVVAKQNIVVAGLDFFSEAFRQIDSTVKVRAKIKDSQRAKKGSTVCEIIGPTGSILKAERVALNILQRLSGIATYTSDIVSLIKKTGVKVVDTRKTTPCMRYMEKYAVRMGGGHNHRFGLYDGILIKDNHIKAAGSIKKAVRKVKDAHHLLNVEVEVKNIREVKEALASRVDVIMLDNMTPLSMKKAVDLIKKMNSDVIVEASGNVTPETIRDIAAAGVDLISIGALTHSAPAADLSLKIT